jgi:hypothetical protein
MLAGVAAHTFKHRPVHLVYSETFESETAAVNQHHVPRVRGALTIVSPRFDHCFIPHPAAFVLLTVFIITFPSRSAKILKVSKTYLGLPPAQDGARILIYILVGNADCHDQLELNPDLFISILLTVLRR